MTIQLVNSTCLPLQNSGFSPALLLFPLRKGTLCSNTAPNSKCGQYTRKTTVQSNQITQAMLKSGNTDWSFPITDIDNKIFAFSFYVNFLQKVFSPKEKAHHFASLKSLLLLKWNWTRMNAKWIVTKTANMTGILEGRASLHYKAKLSKCFQHQNGLATWGDRCFGREKTDDIKQNMGRLLQQQALLASAVCWNSNQVYKQNSYLELKRNVSPVVRSFKAHLISPENKWVQYFL